MPDRAGPALRIAAALAALLAVAAVAEVLREGMRWQRRGIDAAVALTGGDPSRGRAIIERVGCSACHEIPGVVGVAGRVGPSLAGFAARSYIAGVAANQPEHLVRWLVDPRDLSPRTAMPALDLNPVEAHDIAAYLYTLN
jgi:cytochrome c